MHVDSVDTVLEQFLAKHPEIRLVTGNSWRYPYYELGTLVGMKQRLFGLFSQPIYKSYGRFIVFDSRGPHTAIIWYVGDDRMTALMKELAVDIQQNSKLVVTITRKSVNPNAIPREPPSNYPAI